MPDKGIFEAARKGNFAAIQELLDEGIDTNRKDAYGLTALWYAVYHGHTSLVSLLASKCRNPDLVNEALVLAVHRGQSADAKCLLNAGASANVRVPSSRDQTLLIYSVSRGQESISRELLLHGANVNLKDEQERTALHYAAARGDEALLLLLLSNNAKPNLRDLEDKTPLILAVEGGHVESARLLLDRGADASIPARDGNTPLKAAQRLNKTDLVRLLQSSLPKAPSQQ